MPGAATLGIDIGGTTISAGLIDRSGHLVKGAEVPCPRERGGAAMLEAALDAARHLMSEAIGVGIRAIGVCTAGWVDDHGVVAQTVSRVEGWLGTPLKARFVEAFGLPVTTMNDAHAAALGELYFGAGRGVKDFLLVTLGTGIGGALISDGRLVRGNTGIAGALGHTKVVAEGVSCRCGGRGCLERYVSGEAITQSAVDLGFPPTMSARQLADLARNGDEQAGRIWRRAGEMLGYGLVNAIHLLNPAKVLVSGALAEAKELLFGPAQDVVNREVLRRARVPIEPATLGKNAGVIGAAAEAWKMTLETD